MKKKSNNCSSMKFFVLFQDPSSSKSANNITHLHNQESIDTKTSISTVEVLSGESPEIFDKRISTFTIQSMDGRKPFVVSDCSAESEY